MDRERFEWLVAKAVDSLPDEFHGKLENIDVVVEEQPTPYQLDKVGLKRGETLLGLYLVVPDKITIFQKPIEAKCKYDAAVMAEIRRVVLHEIAHHFGITDARLNQLEREKE